VVAATGLEPVLPKIRKQILRLLATFEIIGLFASMLRLCRADRSPLPFNDLAVPANKTLLCWLMD
jgi:hypothetical protein